MINIVYICDDTYSAGGEKIFSKVSDGKALILIVRGSTLDVRI